MPLSHLNTFFSMVIPMHGQSNSTGAHMLSEKSTHVQNLILELNDLADKLERRGKKIIPLHRGDPPLYFPTPKYIIDAYVKALREGRTGYSRAQGTADLVDAVASRYKKYGMHLNEEDVVVTAGVSEALLFINNALIDKGDKAVLFRPYYSQYMARLTTEQGRPILGKMVMAHDWDADIDGLRRTLSRGSHARRPKYMMVTNPHNPTGKVIGRKALKE